jgi:hypothetical protein
MDPCLFLLDHLFCLSHRKTHWTMSVDYVGLQICLLGTSTSMVTLTFFLWCKPKWSRDNSTTNQSSYMALERLHGSWCKQPLRMTFWTSHWKKSCPFQPRPLRLAPKKMHKQINLVSTRKVPVVYPWKVPPRLPTKLICLCIFWVRVAMA